MNFQLRPIAFLTFAALSLYGMASCRNAQVPDAASGGPPHVSAPPAVAPIAAAPVSAAEEASSATARAASDAAPCDHSPEPTPSAALAGHDPEHAPIDCPLRKQGINPSHLRPFEDIEKYIAFLERADRASWQKPDAVVQALQLRGDETVYDVGAGSGYFAFRIAKLLPKGKVVTADIEPEMVRHVHHQAMTQGISNIHAGFAKTDDPQVPASADVVFVCDVLHHVAERPAWLAKMADQMKPGARLVLIEFKEGPLPEGPPEALKISRADTVALVEKAGLKLADEQPDLLPYQTFLLFSKRK